MSPTTTAFHGEGKSRPDPLLTSAKILLYVLLAGTVVVLVVQIIGAPLLVLHAGDSAVHPLWGRILGIVATGTMIGIVSHLLKIVGSVETGDPFTTANGRRLDRIAGDLVALQIIGLIAGGIGYPIGGNINGFDVTVSPGVGGVAVALLVFILARVFRKGAELRADLEGTV